jgi:hypothetical protein
LFDWHAPTLVVKANYTAEHSVPLGNPAYLCCGSDTPSALAVPFKYSRRRYLKYDMLANAGEPDATEQGIISAEQGIPAPEQGILSGHFRVRTARAAELHTVSCMGRSNRETAVGFAESWAVSRSRAC